MFQILGAGLVTLSFIYLTELPLLLKVVFIITTIAIGWLSDFYVVKRVPFSKILSIGILVSLSSFILWFLSTTLGISLEVSDQSKWINDVFLTLFLVIMYLSIRIGASATYFQKKVSGQESSEAEKYLVDTCVIIDGRILEISKSGFIPRSLTIPQFVIQELQLISDSYSHEKRTKGRRGLELLKQMKNSDHLSVRIIQDDIPEEKTVDRKLVCLAKKSNYQVITTDFNLVKVAQLENLQTLNINHLATLIKPSLTVGEKIRIYITKKGNNKNQGVAFLPDDTMVVVEESEKYIGQQRSVIISSYIQNESGRIAFAKLAPM